MLRNPQHIKGFFALLAVACSVLLGLPLSSGALPPSSFGWTPPAFTRLDSLFIISATGEPRFKAQRDSCRILLVAKDIETLDYLIAERLKGQTPRQRHYVEELFVAIADSGRNHPAAARLARALTEVPDSIKVQLLNIGSELHAVDFLPTAINYLKVENPEVKRSAIRNLGMYPDERNIVLLFDGLDKAPNLERQERLWALSKQAPLTAAEWPTLLPLFHDDYFYNRVLVRQIIAKAVAGDWRALAKHCPNAPDDRERLEWILLALDMPGTASKAYVKSQMRLLEPNQTRFILSILADSTGMR